MGLKFDPSQLTEADLLAEFYHRCRLVGIDLRMEIFVPSTLHRSKKMRADAAVLSGNEIIAFVEGKTPGALVGGNTRQKHAYQAFETYHGVPTFWLNSFSQINPLINRLLEMTARVAA